MTLVIEKMMQNPTETIHLENYRSTSTNSKKRFNAGEMFHNNGC
jgi:hypothetical protein